MPSTPETYDQRYTDYQTNRGRLRKWVRGAYLRKAAARLDGPTIDFGCGIGELLRRLPAGSTGLELNRATVDLCVANGLDVVHYDANSDDWSLSPLAERGPVYRSMVISHVLEHLEDPMTAFNKLLGAAGALGVDQVLVIVPGKVGYGSDATHLTFVDRAMLSRPGATRGTGFAVAGAEYFPGDLRAIGDVFIYHELHVRYLRGDARR
ncbi:MAG TPA: methionine biosynthesis protein MetW [Luteimonas sp.]|nr:methionine biosynthesis protein MetW [Luteimonas sp.]